MTSSERRPSEEPSASSPRNTLNPPLRVRNLWIEDVQSLGAKAAALRVRRRLTADQVVDAQCDVAGIPTCKTFASDDGAVAFVLGFFDSGLYVERTQRRPLGVHLIQAMIFAGEVEFDQWADSDPARFHSLVLMDQVRRYGRELLGRRS